MAAKIRMWIEESYPYHGYHYPLGWAGIGRAHLNHISRFLDLRRLICYKFAVFVTKISGGRLAAQ
jgi:hypothetical protein